MSRGIDGADLHDMLTRCPVVEAGEEPRGAHSLSPAETAGNSTENSGRSATDTGSQPCQLPLAALDSPPIATDQMLDWKSLPCDPRATSGSKSRL